MKFRFSLLIVFLLLFCFRLEASHIVGGEFQIIHLSDYNYEIRLNIYFDELNGSPGARDQSVTARIFRVSDGASMGQVVMNLSRINAVPYTIPSCSIDGIRTSRLEYSTKMTLPPLTYGDPAGYYIVWERCCRNYYITNIFSENPQLGSNYAGQTFVLHFPPVLRNGVPFINSSPELFPALSDYACVGRTFVADFSGRDADGDSLAFSFVRPLSTRTSDALPLVAAPPPYPFVTYRPGYSLFNFLGEGARFDITSNGLLSLIPSKPGLFAFAVRCEEFRNGSKIGEVTREYQIFVEDVCQQGVAPTIVAKYSSGDYRSESLDVFLNDDVPVEERCFSVRVKDADSYLNADNKVGIRIVPLNFAGDVSRLLPDITSASITTPDASVEFTLCVNSFPLEPNRTHYQLGVVAYDKTCSVGLFDTVRINLTLDFKTLPKPPMARKAQTIFFDALANRTIGDAAVQLSATSSSGLPIVYSIGNSSRATISSQKITLLQPGPVTVTASQAGDEVYYPATSVTQSFCINPLPPLLTLTRDETGERIISSSTDPHLWYRDNIQIGTNENSLLVEGPLSSYTAKITVDGCASEPSGDLLVTSVEESRPDFFRVYPNPTADVLTIVVDKKSTLSRLQLQDVRGKILTSMEFATETTLDFGLLAPGIYLVAVRVGDSMIVKKVFKH